MRGLRGGRGEGREGEEEGEREGGSEKTVQQIILAVCINKFDSFP